MLKPATPKQLKFIKSLMSTCQEQKETVEAVKNAMPGFSTKAASVVIDFYIELKNYLYDCDCAISVALDIADDLEGKWRSICRFLGIEYIGRAKMNETELAGYNIMTRWFETGRWS